jgi:hypothetical protein
VSSDHQIKLAATIVKIWRLSSNDMHDRVSILLNRNPTFSELKCAEMWDEAFKLAQEGGDAVELAAKSSKTTAEALEINLFKETGNGRSSKVV